MPKLRNRSRTDEETRQKYSLAPGLRTEEFRADELGISRATLARARQRGEIAWTRLGDRPFYSHLHVSEWLEGLERKATAAAGAGVLVRSN